MTAGAAILVVEDDVAIRRLVRAALSRAGYRPIEAPDVRTALAVAAIDKPDLVLLDLGLPDRDGMEAIPLLRAGGAGLIVVSARTDTGEIVAALDLGAEDYLTKPFDTAELLARVRSVLRNRRAGGPGHDLVRSGEVEIDLVRGRVVRNGAGVHLSPKEFAVLAYLAARPDRVIGHGQLLREVWGPAHERQLDYLRIVVRALRQKLEADPARPALIINAPGIGYRLAMPGRDEARRSLPG